MEINKHDIEEIELKEVETLSNSTETRKIVIDDLTITLFADEEENLKLTV